MIIKSEELTGKLTHITRHTIAENIIKDGFKITKDYDRRHFKPHGVWLSLNEDWERWCKSEDFLDVDAHRTIKCKLKPNAKVWLIDSLEDFDELWLKYCAENNIDSSKKNYYMFVFEENKLTFWEWVEKLGIEIIALTKQGQIKTRWDTFMYGWDCASLCVLKPELIEVIK